MKSRIIAVLVTFLAMGAGPSVWAATAPEKAEKVAAKMLKSKESIDATSTQIKATLDSMNAMTSAKGPDLVKRYGEFSDNVGDLESMAKKAKSNAEKARKDREAYLKQWASTQDKIQDEQLKAASKARRDELLPKIDALKESFASVRDTFVPFLQSLKDLGAFPGERPHREGHRHRLGPDEQGHRGRRENEGRDGARDRHLPAARLGADSGRPGEVKRRSYFPGNGIQPRLR